MLRRRNQTLTLMAANGSLTPQRLAEVIRRPLPVVAVHPGVIVHAPSAVGHVIEELKAQGIDNGLEDLLNGRLDVYSTVDVRVQQIVNAALERGLVAYEARHPRARGLVQGSVVVLGNGDGRVLAEAGGRRAVQQPGRIPHRFQPRHRLSSPAGVGDEADCLSRGVPERSVRPGQRGAR